MAKARIAKQAMRQMPSVSSLSKVAKSNGMSNAFLDAGLEAISSVADVWNGKKDVGDAVIDVTGAGIKGGITGAASAAASSVAVGATGTAISVATSTAVGSAIASTAIGGLAVAAAPVAASIGAAFVVGSFISSLLD